MANEDKRTPGLDDAETIIAMRKRHLAAGLRMQAVALRALEELEQKIAAGEPLGITAEDAKTLSSAGEQLERDAFRGKKPDDGGKKPN